MAQGFLRCVQWAPGTKSLVCGFYPNTASPAQVRARGRVRTAGQHLGESSRGVGERRGVNLASMAERQSLTCVRARICLFVYLFVYSEYQSNSMHMFFSWQPI